MESYCYIVECADGTFYTGWTTDPVRRVDVHNRKKGARYTRSRTPVKLVYWERYPERSMAMKRENLIKNLSRYEKQILIKKFQKIQMMKEVKNGEQIEVD